MRKNLFAIGLIAAIYSVQAQNILVHVDDTALTYVSKGTLFYSGGGLQMRGSGSIENHGNFMIEGTSSDYFKTIDMSAPVGIDKTEANGGGNFINKLNEPDKYDQYNVNSSSATPTYTYGQLYISGLNQLNIIGIIDQEFRAINHGTYQQIGLPFYYKRVGSLSTELGKTFNNARRSQNDVLMVNNTNVVPMSVSPSSYIGSPEYPSIAYYMLGGNGLDVSTVTRTIKGRPLSEGSVITLQGAGATVNFGTNGNAENQYHEKYYTYLQDEFVTTPWSGTYGRYMYHYANPFLTNLDLSQIAIDDSNGDGVNLKTIQGVRLEISGGAVQSTSGGTFALGSGAYKYITFMSGVPTGDVDYVMVRPLGTFVIKLTSNSVVDPNDNKINFANLRRFNYYSRSAGTTYNVTANKNTLNNTVKQLGVIGLDANGNEVARTYYVVYPDGTTGHSTSEALTQVKANTSDILGTFEEAPTGGYDTNYSGQYWLYINEANENNFTGKNIKMVNYDLNKIKSYKFEIRENANLVSNGTHALSSGIGFYYRPQNGTVQQAVQGAVIPVNTAEFDLYYGEPSNIVLSTADTQTSTPSRTMVVYNPAITNYIVRFDPNWKKADIDVYDMSGKLVITKKAVDTSTDFVIELDNKIKNAYLVKVVSEKGEIVTAKILK
ncbi:Por secretion system C-terminal sorting domain-containing protein [Chryseobacterium taichungense]|uniref:Por secretion system C-terminal sorting domain-containing protein n=1 Tax=Chryseobacterium taichungense TaxID=295069 RepID=A0A1H7Z3H3_9FLAO|nr:T9SS type A sorting domain-containing protein [Chryseobacterium taichungense]SEM52866.1 Por secretion system C-terminal sorting domain-containing protein [Chryseobacterium taichungense]